jgi:hypothetical protein
MVGSFAGFPPHIFGLRHGFPGRRYRLARYRFMNDRLVFDRSEESSGIYGRFLTELPVLMPNVPSNSSRCYQHRDERDEQKYH